MKSNVKIALAVLALALPVAALHTSSAQTTVKCSVAVVNVNTANDALLLKLPGVGKNILKEIKEYRPFRNVAHFRKELGKYMKSTALDKLAACITTK